MRVTKSPSVVYWLDNTLYLNITNQCSNNCYFCLRKSKTGVSRFNLKLVEEPTVNEIIGKLEDMINVRNWNEVVFCGFGEPLTRLDCVIAVTRWIKRYAGKTVRVDTNGHGYLLNNGIDVVKELKEAGVDRISVSLNAHNAETYAQICAPQFENAFENVLAFIAKAREEFKLEVTAVRLPETDIERIREIAHSMEVRFRLRDYVPSVW